MYLFIWFYHPSLDSNLTRLCIFNFISQFIDGCSWLMHFSNNLNKTKKRKRKKKNMFNQNGSSNLTDRCGRYLSI